MKTYFTKYLPVKGEIKVGDLVIPLQCKTPVIMKNQQHVDFENQRGNKSVKLFICSRDYNIEPQLKLSLQFIEDKNGVKRIPIYVIGEVSSNAIWVKEGDEFDKTDFINKKFVKLLSVPESYPLRNADLNAYYDYNKNFVGTTQVYVIDDYCSSPSFEIDDEYLEFITVCCIKCPTCKRFH